MMPMALVFLVRLVTTAAIVVAATLTVERAGPRIGGIVTGLPIVLGPGLAFIALGTDAPGLSQAATAGLWSLSATQAFMLTYGLAAPRARPARATGLAILAWLAVAGSVHALTQHVDALRVTPWPAAVAFLAMTGVLRTVLDGRAPPRAPVAGSRHALLALRAVLAGVLVGAVTVSADWLGPLAAGLLVGFPVGMTTIAISLHQRLGAAATVAALHATGLGLLSLGSFCLVTALLSGPLSSAGALWAGLGAALAVSAGLAVALRPRGGRLPSRG